MEILEPQLTVLCGVLGKFRLNLMRSYRFLIFIMLMKILLQDPGPSVAIPSRKLSSFAGLSAKPLNPH